MFNDIYFTIINKYICSNSDLCFVYKVHHNSQNNGSFHMKLEHIVIYEKAEASLTLRIVQSRSRPQRDFKIFLLLILVNIVFNIVNIKHLCSASIYKHN